MILKDSFRYQNFYDKLINEAYTLLIMNNNITQRKQEHLRSKSNPDAEDETIIVKAECFENEKIVPMNVVTFLMDILEEKEKLTAAIATAKSTAKINIDATIEMNKVRQQIAGVFRHMSGIKSYETKATGRSMMLNADKNQVPYTYDINEVITIDFNRNVVKSLMKKLNEQSDKASAEIDFANITVEVNYTPKYELDDTLEDCIINCCSIS